MVSSRPSSVFTPRLLGGEALGVAGVAGVVAEVAEAAGAGLQGGILTPIDPR